MKKPQLRIVRVVSLPGQRLRLTLSDGKVVKRDLTGIRFHSSTIDIFDTAKLAKNGVVWDDACFMSHASLIWWHLPMKSPVPLFLELRLPDGSDSEDAARGLR